MENGETTEEEIPLSERSREQKIGFMLRELMRLRTTRMAIRALLLSPPAKGHRHIFERLGLRRRLRELEKMLDEGYTVLGHLMVDDNMEHNRTHHKESSLDGLIKDLIEGLGDKADGIHVTVVNGSE